MSRVSRKPANKPQRKRRVWIAIEKPLSRYTLPLRMKSKLLQICLELDDPGKRGERIPAKTVKEAVRRVWVDVEKGVIPFFQRIEMEMYISKMPVADNRLRGICAKIGMFESSQWKNALRKTNRKNIVGRTKRKKQKKITRERIIQISRLVKQTVSSLASRGKPFQEIWIILRKQFTATELKSAGYDFIRVREMIEK